MLAHLGTHVNELLRGDAYIPDSRAEASSPKLFHTLRTPRWGRLGPHFDVMDNHQTAPLSVLVGRIDEVTEGTMTVANISRPSSARAAEALWIGVPNPRHRS